MSEFDKLISNVDEIYAEHNLLKKKMQETLQENFKVIFSAFFTDHPTVKTVHWTQYIPGFNDGDECTFTIGEIYFTNTTYDKLEETYGEDDENNIENGDEKYTEDCNKLCRLVHTCGEDILRAMFGTHVHVKAYAGGFEIDEYDCGY